MSCLQGASREHGYLRDPQDRKFLDVITDLWDGQLETWSHATKNQGKTKVKNAWLHIIAATTPAWLKRNMSIEMVEGCCMSRVIFVYGDKKRYLVPYPSQLIIPEDHEETKQMLIEDLREIANLVGQYKLTPEAIALGDPWYRNEVWGVRPAHLASGRFEGYLSRKQTHVHKLAIVLAASQRDELIITKKDLETSI